MITTEITERIAKLYKSEKEKQIMTDDLRFFLEDLNDDHPMRKEAFIKYVFQGNTINIDELYNFGLTAKQIEYVCNIYDWISTVEGLINKRFK